MSNQQFSAEAWMRQHWHELTTAVRDGHLDHDALDGINLAPTMAEMTTDERQACQWMQADITSRSGRYVIAYVESGSTGQIMLLDSHGGTLWAHGDKSRASITPRPDLPRLVWPADTPEDEDTPEDDVAYATRLARLVPDQQPRVLNSYEEYNGAKLGTVLGSFLGGTTGTEAWVKLWHDHWQPIGIHSSGAKARNSGELEGTARAVIWEPGVSL